MSKKAYMLMTAAASAILGSTLVGQAHAQSSKELDSIVVTAQKREENLQAVPLSITAISADQFEKARLQSAWDIAELTPGVDIWRTGPVNQAFSMRGVLGGDGGAGSDRSVVLFLDDVYIGRSSGFLFDLYDVERVEVLKGPQGTLSGRNAAGGAIRIITRDPSEDLTGAVEATVGNYGLFEGKARISGALTDKVAAGISVTTKQRNGYYTLGPGVVSPNAVQGKDTDAPSSTTVRAKFVMTPSEDVKASIGLTYSTFHQDGVSKKIYPTGTFVGNTFGFTPDPDPWLVEGYVPGYADSEMYVASGRLDWDTPVGTLTSVTGLVHADAQSGQDSIFMPKGLWRSFLASDEKATTVTQELRLSSSTEGGAFTWLAGVYFLHEDIERIESYDRDYLGATSYPIYNQDNTTNSYAVFGNLSFAITKKLTLTAGARYTVDEKSMDNFLLDGLNGTSTNGLVPATSLYDISASDDWESFTPKVSLEFAPTDALFFYASYSEGFKAGGFQGVAPEAVAASTPFAPEEVNNYELGLKSRWFDNRLQFNVSAFYMDYTDMQLSLRILTIPGDESSALRLLTNASDAKIQGLESEFRAIPIPGLTLTANYTYLDTELENYDPGFGGTDLSGNKLPSPTHAFTISGNYEIDLGDGSNITLYGDYRYNGERFLSLANTPAGAAPLAATEPHYGVASLRATYETATGWRFSAWGKNIGDKLYRVNTIIIGDSGFSDFGDPATYGFTIGKDF